MKIKQFLFMAGFAALFAACSSDDESQRAADPSELVPVTLGYQTTPTVQNRAAAQLTLNDDYIASGKTVRVRISNTGAGEYANKDYTTGDAGALILPAEAPYYPLDGTNIDILAYYPSYDTSDFTVESDQTTDDNYLASDLMWATPLENVAKTTDTRTLTFSHKMAKIIVNAEAGTAIKEINYVKVLQVKPTVSMNKISGEITATKGDPISIDVIKSETAASVSGAAVIPAQTITGNLLEIGVTKTDDTQGVATYSVPSGKAFAANGVYTLNISVNWPEVGATTEITGWSESGSVTINPLRAARVGDLYFSDGTWGTAAENPGKTPIGIVFCTPTSAKDQALGYYQGYVMALKRANNGSNVANWCVSALQSTQVTDVLYGSTNQPVQWGNITTDLDGLTHCNTALDGRTQSDLTAINYAKTYTPAAPASTDLLPNSGWYLPSIGQQYQWLIAFASSSTYYANIKNYGNWTWRSDYADFYLNNSTYSDASGNIATAINTYVNDKLSTDENKALYESFAKGHYLWSSTERAAGYPFSLGFRADGRLYLDGNGAKSVANRQVRAVLAF